MSTPYGDPSAPISVGDVGGRPVAFLPRHGAGHEYPPHRIPYRANLWALRSLGVQQVLAPCAVGGLQPETQPGTLVVPDQLVDRTTTRVQTYVDTGAVHAPFADPYCPDLRAALVDEAGEGVLPDGTMVVIEGPRFSTRAESQSYARAGWSVVNMTGHPEAVLARELGVCYATIALVTDLDAGVSAEESVDQAQVFALFEKHIGRLKELLGTGGRRAPRDADLRVRRLAGGRHAAVRAAGTLVVRVLLTGSAGFIGAQVDEQLTARGRRGRPRRRPHPGGPRPGAHVPDDVHRVDVRDADRWADLLDGVDVVCHQAAMVGAGVTVADLPSYAGHNDLGTAVLLAAMHERGVDALVLASSMVVYGEGRYACEQHGDQQPPAPSRDALEGGDFENHCAHCGRTARPGSWCPRTRASTRAAAMRRASWPRSTTRSRGPGRHGRAAIGLRYHNVYGPGMPRDTPYSGVAAIFRSSLESGQAPRVFEDGGQMRDFVHVHDVARANLLAIDAVAGEPAESWSTYNVCSGSPVPILRVAELLAEASGGPRPR